MSMNLALEKGKDVDHNTLYQTPTSISYAAIDSGNPFEYYKNWLIKERQGSYKQETREHLAKVETLIKQGFKFTII